LNNKLIRGGEVKKCLPIVVALMMVFQVPSFADSKAVVIDELAGYLEFVDYGGATIFAQQIPKSEYAKMMIIDARDAGQFAKSHIPGAVNIEWRKVLEQRDKIPKDKMVLIYCNTGSLSAQAGFALRVAGYENVKILQGGFEEWKAKGGLDANAKAMGAQPLMLVQAAVGQSTSFQHFGNFKRMMHTSDTAGQVELSKLEQSAGTWGVGALAGLKGEVIQVDGKLLVSLGTDPDGKVQAPQTTDAAVLWASGKVTQWKQVLVPSDMTQAQFEKFVSDQAAVNELNLNQPFVFRVTGGYSHLIWHVLTGEKPEVGSTAQGAHAGHGHGHGHGGGHANKKSGMKVFRNPTATGQLVAVYSGQNLEGVVSHPGERLHVHYIDDAQTVSGHVDQYNIRSGATLWLPAR
jgi:rhodanese-related sulfurtransferase/alpha-acetolactate decarboxylase